MAGIDTVRYVIKWRLYVIVL